jgi:hypothetical protein
MRPSQLCIQAVCKSHAHGLDVEYLLWLGDSQPYARDSPARSFRGTDATNSFWQGYPMAREKARF